MNTEVWFRNKQLLLKMSTYLGSYENKNRFNFNIVNIENTCNKHMNKL